MKATQTTYIKEKAAQMACICILASLMLTTILTTTASPWPETLLYMQSIAIAGIIAAAAMRIMACERPHATAADITICTWWCYIALRTYTDNSTLTAGRQLAAYTTLAGTYALVRIMPKPTSRPLSCASMATVLLLATTAYELLLGMWQMYSGTSHHRLFLATGSMFNPGPYSAYIAMGMAIAISLMHDAHDADWHKPRRAALPWLCMATAMAGCFVIAVTQSRSAMIAVVAATAWTFRNDIKRKHAILLLAATAMAAVGLFFMKAGSAMGRIVIWRQAAGIIAESPLFGSGLGSFAGEYGRQLAMFFADSHNATAFAQYADVADYAFCDILQIFAEQGIIGGTLCIAFVAVSLRKLRRTSKHLFVAMTTLLAFSLFSYPMQLLPFQTIVICLAAIAQDDSQGQSMGHGASVALPVGHKAPVGIAAACIIFTICCHTVTKQHVACRTEYASIKGMTHSTFIADYYRLLPTCSDDKRFLFDFARLLQSNGRHLDACAILRRGTQVSGDPMFWTLMGNSFKAMRQYGQAARCYDHAFAVLPNRIYPMYRKMLLFRDMGDTDKARKTARQLLEVKPKVESAATRKMQEEARRYKYRTCGKKVLQTKFSF